MAKIDVTKISGYADMTPEEKLSALEAYEFEVEAPAPASDNEVRLKEALSRANSQAAEYKRQLREKQTEVEREAAERAERDKERDEELATLRRERTISKFEAQYLAAGYSPELASASAKAQADNDTETVLANQLKFIAETKKNLEAAALGKQPPLTPGQPPKAQSDEDKFFETVARYAGLK